jgi:hypothetical protein
VLGRVGAFLRPVCNRIRRGILAENRAAKQRESPAFLGSGLPEYSSFSSVPVPSTNYI